MSASVPAATMLQSPSSAPAQPHPGSQDVVGLDVGVQHAAVAQVVQRHQHLLRVHTHLRWGRGAAGTVGGDVQV